jgi:hypothetical protein
MKRLRIEREVRVGGSESAESESDDGRLTPRDKFYAAWGLYLIFTVIVSLAFGLYVWFRHPYS